MSYLPQPHTRRRTAARLVSLPVGTFLVLLAACTTSRPMKDLLSETRPKLPPQRQPPTPPVRDALPDFNNVLRAYVFSDRDIVIRNDGVFNESLEKTWPTDVRQTLAQVLSDMAPPVRMLQAEKPVLQGVFPSVPITPPQGPQPDFVIYGNVVYRNTVAASERRVQGGFETNGRPKSNADHSRDDTREAVEIKVGLTIGLPNGLAVASCMYRIIVERHEQSTSTSVFIAGSGGGVDRKFTVQENSGDGLYEAMFAIVANLLGHALKIPYYRVSPIFAGGDSVLDASVRQLLNRMSRLELEQQVKRFMWIDGFPMIQTTPVMTDADRAVAALFMRQQSLDFSDHTSLVEAAFRLWRTLDFRSGARRVRDLLDSIAATPPPVPESVPTAGSRPRCRRACAHTSRGKVNLRSVNPTNTKPPTAKPDMRCAARTTRTETNLSCTVRAPAADRGEESSAKSPALVKAPPSDGGKPERW